MIANSTYPIYLADNKLSKTRVAVKLFPFRKDLPSPSFDNEIRIQELRHPNVVSLIKTVEKDSIIFKNTPLSISYVVMPIAFCDFDKLVNTPSFYKDETLVRTYFQHLVQGLEYLHVHNFAHMDLKPENLLLGEDYRLKIADFDLAFKKGDEMVRGKGSYDFRCPELKESQVKNAFSTDLYSLGVILFVMRTGCMPYFEAQNVRGYNLYGLLLNDIDGFWSAYSRIAPSTKKLGYEFKQLFNGLTRPDPEDRISLEKVKENEWYRGPVYGEEEIKEKIDQILKESPN
jgi:serine/threonine protein kinase